MNNVPFYIYELKQFIIRAKVFVLIETGLNINKNKE